MTQNDDLKLLLSKANDAIELCENKYMIKGVGFLTPAERVYIEKNCKKILGGRIIYLGGYPEAERTMFFAVPEYIEDSEVEEELALLEISGRNINELSHRDFLGSLMGLGIKREMVGDILPFEEKCLVFVRTEIADYIISNLEKIGRYGIKIESVPISKVEIPKKKTEEISGTVAAPRLDSVLSVALKTSRSKATDFITAGLVSLNWEETENLSKAVLEGDVISVKGKGRFKVSSVGGQTKKGRFGIIIDKYI